MAKYQDYLSRVGSNRDRAALRGIFSMFLTDNDPPKLKDLELASIVLSGAETTQVTISGACTTGILQSGTSTTAYSITGAFTTGISIAADGTTAIAVTSAFSGANAISLAGSASTAGLNISGDHTTGITIGAQTTAGIAITGATTTGVNISGACTTALSITGANTDGISITRTDPSTASNGVKVAMTCDATWSGSIAGIRSTVTASAAAAIGNMYGGRFELIEDTVPTSQGHTAALYAQTTVTGAGNNPTSVLTLTLAGATGGELTPFILFQDASTSKSTVLMSVGSAGNLVGVTSGDIYYNETLRILANAVARFIPLSTAEGTYTTAYPIITTKVNAGAAYNQIYVSGTESATFSGSVVGVRSTLTMSATAAIGNMYAGRFELIQSGLPSSQGHTCALMAQTTVTGASNNPTSVLTLALSGASGGALTPFILFQDASTDKSTVLMSVGSAGNLVGTTSGDIYYNETLRILANTSARFIPLSTAEGTFTTAYPVIIQQSAGPTTASNALYVTQTLNANWTGSQAGLRIAVDSSATGAIGNARALMSKLTMSAQPSSQGHTAAAFFEGATVDAATNLTGIVSLTKSGAAGGANTPFLYIEEAGTTKSTLFTTLFNVGAGTAGEMVRTNVSIAATSEITLGLRVSINGAIYYLVGIAVADV